AAAHPRGAEAGRDIAGYLSDRLKAQQRDAGIRHDIIDAVAAVRQSTDNWLIIRRVQALQSFLGTEDGANLLASYKRAANILKKEGWGESSDASPSYTPEAAEDALVA